MSALQQISWITLVYFPLILVKGLSYRIARFLYGNWKWFSWLQIQQISDYANEDSFEVVPELDPAQCPPSHFFYTVHYSDTEEKRHSPDIFSSTHCCLRCFRQECREGQRVTFWLGSTIRWSELDEGRRLKMGELFTEWQSVIWGRQAWITQFLRRGNGK